MFNTDLDRLRYAPAAYGFRLPLVNGRVRVGGLSFLLVTLLLLFDHDLLAMSGGLEDDIYDGMR